MSCFSKDSNKNFQGDGGLVMNYIIINTTLYFYFYYSSFPHLIHPLSQAFNIFSSKGKRCRTRVSKLMYTDGNIW